MWLKYRAKFNSGPGKWRYHDMGTEAMTGEDIDDLIPWYESSVDGYRGVEYEFIPVPPKEDIYA